MARASTPSWPPRGWLRHGALVDAEHPALAGHFPGRPLLPGIAQLHFFHRLVREEYGSAFLCGLRRVKFRAPVAPARCLGADLFPTAAEGELQFELRDRGAAPADPVDSGDREHPVVADGHLIVAPQRQPEPAAAPMTPSVPLANQPDMRVILPHRGPALLLREALADSRAPTDCAWFRGHVPGDSFLVDGDRVSALAAIELCAQAAAVLSELVKPPGEPLRMLDGMLVSVREASFEAPDFALEDDLVAGVRTTSRGGFYHIRGEVRTVRGRAAQRLCTAMLQIFVP